jgi:hypothetical protein
MMSQGIESQMEHSCVAHFNSSTLLSQPVQLSCNYFGWLKKLSNTKANGQIGGHEKLPHKGVTQRCCMLFQLLVTKNNY